MRSLLQFFFPKNPKTDDVLAQDYFENESTWEPVRGEMGPALSRVDARVGKEVAHLTYARLAVTDEAKPWTFLEIAEAINELGATFRKHVDSDLLGPRFGRGRPDA